MDFIFQIPYSASGKKGRRYGNMPSPCLKTKTVFRQDWSVREYELLQISTKKGIPTLMLTAYALTGKSG